MLITGALDFVVEPLRPLFDEIVCAPRRADAPTARYTGELTDVPPTGETRAQVLFDYADAEGTSSWPRVGRLRRLDVATCPMLEAVGFPVAVNPETRLAALARKRGWLVEQWSPRPPARPRPAAADRARWRSADVSATSERGRSDEGARCSSASCRGSPRPRSPAASRPARAPRVGPLAPRRRRPARAARPPAGSRVRPRLAGICGRDLATIDGHVVRYFEPIVSFPFVPGHEVVADLDDGRRVVLDPVLGCVARGIDPPCAACARGELELRAHRLRPPRARPPDRLLRDTGGGWSHAFVAHESQLHPVPDDLTDEAAVMVEPTACAVHAAAVAALAEATWSWCSAPARSACSPSPPSATSVPTGTIVAAAKHPEQQRLARRARRRPRRRARRAAAGSCARCTGSMASRRPQLTGGADASSTASAPPTRSQQALAVVAPAATSCWSACPARSRVDLTALWHRETELAGAYAYGTEHAGDALRDRAARSTVAIRAASAGRAARPARRRATYPPAPATAERHRARRQRRRAAAP